MGESDSFGCSLSCQDGASAAGGSTSDLPPAGIFTPPYSINDGNVQLPIDTKVLLTPASPCHMPACRAQASSAMLSARAELPCVIKCQSLGHFPLHAAAALQPPSVCQE